MSNPELALPRTKIGEEPPPLGKVRTFTHDGPRNVSWELDQVSHESCPVSHKESGVV